MKVLWKLITLPFKLCFIYANNVADIMLWITDSFVESICDAVGLVDHKDKEIEPNKDKGEL